MSTPAPPGPGPLADGALRDAVLAGLAAEHAAVWAHGLASAFLPSADETALADAATAHRDRRDAVTAMLTTAGVAPVAAAPAYRPPAPVVDGPTAAGLLVVAEGDVAAAWRAVCERTPAGPASAPGSAALRSLAVDAVVASATTGVRWRRLARVEPVVPVLPGAPNP